MHQKRNLNKSDCSFFPYGMLLLGSFINLRWNPPKKEIKSIKLVWVVAMRALEHRVFWKGGRWCVLYIYMFASLWRHCPQTERKGLILIFFSLLERTRGFGLYAFCIDMLVFIGYECLKKVQRKSELPSQDCVLLKFGVLKFLTTHSQQSRLCFLCSSTFFPLTFWVCFTPLIHRRLWTPVAGHS